MKKKSKKKKRKVKEKILKHRRGMKQLSHCYYQAMKTRRKLSLEYQIYQVIKREINT